MTKYCQTEGEGMKSFFITKEEHVRVSKQI